MRLAIVPTEVVSTSDLGLVRRPVLPAGFHSGAETHLWGQASSQWSTSGKMLVWLRPLQRSWIDQLKAQPSTRYVSRVAEDTTTGEMLAAMRSGSGSGAAREAFTYSYRVKASDEETRRAIIRATRAISWWGLVAAATWLSAQSGMPYLAALTVLHQDNFNRSDRSLDGDTMSDALGSWSMSKLTAAILSNQVEGDNDAIAYDSAMPSEGVQRVSATLLGTSLPGIYSVARHVDADNYYMCGAGGTGKTQLYSKVSGSYTQLGSDGSANVSGDVLACDTDGSSISGYINGSLDVGPITNANHSAGSGGIRFGNKSANKLVDDWQVETVASPSGLSIPVAMHHYNQMRAC